MAVPFLLVPNFEFATFGKSSAFARNRVASDAVDDACKPLSSPVITLGTLAGLLQ